MDEFQREDEDRAESENQGDEHEKKEMEEEWYSVLVVGPKGVMAGKRRSSEKQILYISPKKCIRL